MKRNAGTARVFSFGIGTSVNRFLLDGMARAGRGEVQYILDEQDAAGAAERFYERVRTPVLTDVKLDFGDLQGRRRCIRKQIPDLFSSTPIVVKGQYKEAGQGTITLRGKTGEGQVRAEDRRRPARRRAEERRAGPAVGPGQGRRPDEPGPGGRPARPARTRRMKEEILGLGLRFQLADAVHQLRGGGGKAGGSQGRQAETVAVPVEMPEGVSYEGVFGHWTGQVPAGS